MATDAWKSFGGAEDEVIELRRFVLRNEAPKNSESRFLGWCIRFLKKFCSAKTLVTYADESAGHIGTIYKAAGFKYVGAKNTPGAWVLNGRRFHDRAARTKYRGELKPFAARLALAIDCGDATKTEATVKHCYRMDLTA